MKYLLVEVIEREISIPELFDTHAAAHDQMCKYVAEVLDIPEKDVKESCHELKDLDENTCVLGNVAWTEKHGENYDWRIFRVDDAGQIE